MIMPGNRYNYKRKKKLKFKRKVILLFLFFIFSIIPIILFTKERLAKNTDNIVSFEKLWLDGKYNELSDKCEKILLTDPLNTEALIYNGFSYFHHGISQFTLEEQLPLLDLAILNLRKALLLRSNTLAAKVNYILGKSYYHKGRFYMNEAIFHIEKSIKLGYSNEDSYKYLGLSYSELGFYEKGVQYFLKALNDKYDDILLLVIGQTYYKLEDNYNSRIYLKKAIELHSNFRVEIKSRFLLGKIFTESGDFEEAEEQYNLILSKDSSSADAHYYLGELFSGKGDIVKARAEWRKALKLDPSHHGALSRLY